jgi:NAD(P)-dependent dehydrogenase (short-subunit alcohol dehydrogenase family)
MRLLRDHLLDGQTVVLAGSVDADVAGALVELGARVERLAADLDETTGAQWAGAHAPLHALVYSAGGAFAEGGREGLNAALEHAWMATRAVATGAQIPGDAGGKIVLLTPAPDAGAYAEAARSGLENLARTLAVEWARYRITVTALAPGGRTTAGQLGTLLGYLLSPAGDYFSGCRFDLN